MQPLQREQVWESIQHPWDLIVVGGGITGAGVFRAAAAAGLQVLLLDADDFAFGTSSRSSKLVHGGLRYLNQKQYGVTFESVRERQRMLKNVPELVKPLCFLISNYAGGEISTRKYLIGLILYDLMGSKWDHGRLSREKVLDLCPQIRSEGLVSGLFYYDAVVDDARLVLRLIEEGKHLGGTALNYARVTGLLRNLRHEVSGVAVQRSDGSSQEEIEITASVVINATGPWTDTLRGMLACNPVIRKQRGSHLVIDRAKLTLDRAITFNHPDDQRTMFFIPWLGTTIVGTTDLDHPQEYEDRYHEPFIDRQEFVYMMQAVHAVFPAAGVETADIISTYAGLRPIIRADSSSPSAQSRKHHVFEENGLLTITGGKLTTFRLMAKAVLERAKPMLQNKAHFHWHKPFFNRLYTQPVTGMQAPQDLTNRYGKPFLDWLGTLENHDFTPFCGTAITPLEIYYTAEHESVVHLDDLLLRRVRLGLVHRGGGADCLPHLKERLQYIMNWSELDWNREVDRYLRIIRESYSIPG